MSHDVTLAAIITVGVLLGLIIVVGLPVVLTVRNAVRQREFEHAERMKALELGRPWPGAEPPEEASEGVVPSDGAVKIGVWVPLGALGIAFAATMSHSRPADGADMAMWISAAAVGVAGLVCGTILAMRAPAAAAATPAPRAPLKPTLEEDTLDVVSRRG